LQRPEGCGIVGIRTMSSDSASNDISSNGDDSEATVRVYLFFVRLYYYDANISILGLLDAIVRAAAQPRSQDIYSA
jgi:hypothetical protein